MELIRLSSHDQRRSRPDASLEGPSEDCLNHAEIAGSSPVVPARTVPGADPRSDPRTPFTSSEDYFVVDLNSEQLVRARAPRRPWRAAAAVDSTFPLEHAQAPFERVAARAGVASCFDVARSLPGREGGGVPRAHKGATPSLIRTPGCGLGGCT